MAKIAYSKCPTLCVDKFEPAPEWQSALSLLMFVPVTLLYSCTAQR